ncbi:MAG: RHS repeat-associated core domain-containing protein, partial [Prevotellaceae bacterium]|nr:RHS repeat-associated core domain-containing protein [Prevotellaceae bacterium]
MRNDTILSTRYYTDNYEEEIEKDSNIRKIHYLWNAIYIDNSKKEDEFYYIYTDYQGSLLALINENDSVVERYAYDAWGRRRNLTDWTQWDMRTQFKINRGYTAHEHIDDFGIINMNGRIYDPVTAQFFSPDPFMQFAD